MPPHERPNPRQQWNRHGPQWEARLDGEVRRDELGDMEDAGKLLSALTCVMMVELDHSYPFNPAWLTHLDEPATASAHYLFRASSTTVPYHIRNWPSSRDITLQPYPWARTHYFKHIDVYEDGNQDPHRIRAHHEQGNYRLRCPTLLPWVASADRFHPHVWPSHRRLMTHDLARINIENLHVDGISG